MTSNNIKVILGMSGGVDSSVAVYLLQQAGYEVHGVHMLMIPDEFSPNPHAASDAESVAKQFGIKTNVHPHVNTYYSFSEVINSKGTSIRDGQMMVREGTMFVFDYNKNSKNNMNIFTFSIFIKLY